MSSQSRHVTEHELDGLLRSLLGTPELAGTRAIERALEEVAATPQDRPRLIIRRPVGRSTALWAAAAMSLLAVSIVVSAGLLGIITPSPTPSPSASSQGPSSEPSPSIDPNALVRVGSEADGYVLLVPASWLPQQQTFVDTHSWAGPSGSVMVSYGTSIFEGGVVTQCGPPTEEWPLCMEQEYPNSIPYRPETDGVAPLSIDGFVRDRCLGGCDVTETDTTLGGELAKRAQTVAAGLRATYVSTFHDRRPVVVYWSQPADAFDDDLVEQMRASFEFVAPPGGPVETPFADPTELVPYTNGSAGYEILVPRSWGEGEANERFPTIHQFSGGETTDGSVQLSISVGEPDGTVAVCQNNDCATIVATSLDELEAKLISIPVGMRPAFKPPHSGDVTLGGQPGRFMRPGFRKELGDGDWGLRGAPTGNCLGCPGVRYFAYTIKDGRPVVIAIDWWVIAFERLRPSYLADILASFRFTT